MRDEHLGTAERGCHESAISPRNRSTEVNERIRCPNPMCPQPDDVRKVSVIAEEMNALNMMGVTGQLQAPERPPNGGRWGCMVATLIISVPIALIGIAGLFSSLAGLSGLLPPPANPSNNFTPTVGALVSLGYTLVFGGISVWAVYSQRKGAAQWKRAYPAWQRAMARWEQLYYCNRCGSVFNPNEPGRFVPASRMKELLA